MDVALPGFLTAATFAVAEHFRHRSHLEPGLRTIIFAVAAFGIGFGVSETVTNFSDITDRLGHGPQFGAPQIVSPLPQLLAHLVTSGGTTGLFYLTSPHRK